MLFFLFCFWTDYAYKRSFLSQTIRDWNDLPQGYCRLENVRGHFVENTQLESLSPISLHYKTHQLFQNEGANLKIKGQFCPWPF